MTLQKKPEKSRLKDERVRRTSALIWTAVALAVLSVRFSGQAERFAPNAPQGSVRIRLFDVYSGLPLANAAVQVTSDNGIRCKQAPCPTNGATWSGHSDDSGVLVIPPSAIQFDTYVKTTDHRSVKLAEDAIKDSLHIHQVELYPEWLYGEQYDWTRGYKLVDARSGKLLANIPVRLEFSTNDWPAQHGGISHLDLKTNPLGYVFFSFLRKPEPKQAQTLPSGPLADWMTPEAWVAVSGYRKAKLNYFDGLDDERSVIRLQQWEY